MPLAVHLHARVGGAVERLRADLVERADGAEQVAAIGRAGRPPLQLGARRRRRRRGRHAQRRRRKGLPDGVDEPDRRRLDGERAVGDGVRVLRHGQLAMDEGERGAVLEAAALGPLQPQELRREHGEARLARDDDGRRVCHRVVVEELVGRVRRASGRGEQQGERHHRKSSRPRRRKKASHHHHWCANNWVGAPWACGEHSKENFEANVVDMYSGQDGTMMNMATTNL